MEWVPEFYRKQYEWADWRDRWADFDPATPDPHVDAVRRLAGDSIVTTSYPTCASAAAVEPVPAPSSRIRFDPSVALREDRR